MRRKTTEECINDFQKVHGNEYDYSLVKYKNNATKVEILCHTHGIFWQTPAHHLMGQKCPICSKLSSISNRTSNTKDFIGKSLIIHKNENYDYSKVVYKNAHAKVCIICPEHGEFWQKPNNHLSGQGCPICGLNNKALKHMKTTEDFIEEANIIHNNFYDYSKFIYQGVKEKGTIICKEHGEFMQSPENHLKGYGCPKCRSSLLENEIRCFLQTNKINFEEQKRFEWLDKKSLDFYIPTYNVAIECQGIQHFKENEHFGGEKGLKEIKSRDEIKYNLCKNNGIRLLYYANYQYNFPYTVFTNKEKLLYEIKENKQ